MTGYRLWGLHTLTLCKTKIIHFTALFKTRHLILWFTLFLTLHALIYQEINFAGKKLVDTTNVDRLSPTFTFFERSRVQKDALWKALDSETVYHIKIQEPVNYTLLGSQKHITQNTRLGPVRECPHSPGNTMVFCLASTAFGEKSLIWERLKNPTKKDLGKLIEISIISFFF